MAKGIYIGVDNTAKKVKKVYIGVDGVAKKVKKAYIGVGGVARPCFSSEKKLEFYGSTTSLSEARSYLAATTLGNYALFGGGESGPYNRATVYDTIDIYTSTAELYTEKTLTLSQERSRLAATTIGNYAIFAGGSNGYSNSSAEIYDTVDAYNTSFTRITPTTLSQERRTLTAASNDTYALFAGGEYIKSGSIGECADVDVYSINGTSLTHATKSDLNVARSYVSSGTINNNIVVIGGYDGSDRVKTIDIYDATLTHSVHSNGLSVARESVGIALAGENLLLAGGLQNNGYSSSVVDVLNKELVLQSPSLTLSNGLVPVGTSLDGYAIFSGDLMSYMVTNAFDENLTLISLDAPNTDRFDIAATSVGKYAIYAGGYNSSNSFNNAYAYTVLE